MRVFQNQTVCCDDCKPFHTSGGDDYSVCRVAVNRLGKRVGLLCNLKGNGQNIPAIFFRLLSKPNLPMLGKRYFSSFLEAGQFRDRDDATINGIIL